MVAAGVAAVSVLAAADSTPRPTGPVQITHSFGASDQPRLAWQNSQYSGQRSLTPQRVRRSQILLCDPCLSDITWIGESLYTAGRRTIATVHATKPCVLRRNSYTQKITRDRILSFTGQYRVIQLYGINITLHETAETLMTCDTLCVPRSGVVHQGLARPARSGSGQPSGARYSTVHGTTIHMQRARWRIDLSVIQCSS